VSNAFHDSHDDDDDDDDDNDNDDTYDSSYHFTPRKA
jgi:hypothetical protein